MKKHVKNEEIKEKKGLMIYLLLGRRPSLVKTKTTETNRHEKRANIMKKNTRKQ